MKKVSDQAAEIAATLLSPRDGESLHSRPVGLSIEVVEGPDRGKSFDLAHVDVITGGRASSHDVVLSDDSVSTTHFEITVGPRGVILRDLGSMNGTWIGRTRLLDGSVSLFHGAQFYAGDTKLRLASITTAKVARSNLPMFGTLAGQSATMRDIFVQLDRIAPTPLKILITGETGTGKEEVARTLHALSGRKGPFVVLDCGALPHGLAEAAIFGHVKGAFTGATSDRPGPFEVADGGTLFLDEIGELPLELQPDLLRVIDRREVTRVGTSVSRTVDVRVLAATNRNLLQLVADGRFRLDLLHRIKQIEVPMPPLRARPEDVPMLARHFLARTREAYGDRVASDIDESVTAALSRRYWEGNVRELRNVIETLAHLATSPTITLGDLDRFVGRGRMVGGSGAHDLATWCAMPRKEAVDLFERYYLEAVRALHDGNVEKMCTHMGYTRKGLRGFYERLGIPWSAQQGADGLDAET